MARKFMCNNEQVSIAKQKMHGGVQDLPTRRRQQLTTLRKRTHSGR